MRAILTLAFLAVISFINSPYSYAQAVINDEGAAHLQAMFENAIKQQKTSIEAQKNATLILKGDISVEQEATYYAITLPHISIAYPKGETLNIGIIAINAQPHDNKNQWKVTAAIPTPLVFKDPKEEKSDLKINIGRQHFSAILNEQFNFFTKLDARYKDIVINGSKRNTEIKIPNISILYDFIENQDKTLSGEGQVSLENIEISIPDFSSEITLEKLSLNINMEDYDPNSAIDQSNEIQSLANEDEALTTNQKNEIKDTIFKALETAKGGGEIEYNLKNLRITYPSKNEETQNTEAVENAEEKEEILQTFQLDSASFGTNIQNLGTDKVKIGFKAGYSGLQPPKNLASYNAIAPSTGHIEIELENIPFLQLLELTKDTIQDSNQGEGAAKMAGLSAMMKAPAYLSQAQTSLVINNNIGNSSYKVNIDAKAKADITAKNSATIDARINLQNMDWLLGEMEKQKADPEQKSAFAFASILGILQTLKEVAETGIENDGAPIHIFNLLMDKSGTITVNGLDISAFMGANAVQHGSGTMPAVPIETPTQQDLPQ